jgi:hypothetical protein
MNLRNPRLDPRNWNPARLEGWTVVSPDVGLPTGGAFGSELFIELLRHSPELREELVCFRYSAQPEDTVAVFDRTSRAFGIQVDPLMEYIIVFDGESRNEIGPWFDDSTAEALTYIWDHFLKGLVD